MGRYTLNPHILLASTSGKIRRIRKRARDSERTKSESITKSAAGLDTIVMGTVFIRNKSEGLTKNAASLADKGVSFVNHGVIGGKG